jgi:hypothetical protein
VDEHRPEVDPQARQAAGSPSRSGSARHQDRRRDLSDRDRMNRYGMPQMIAIERNRISRAAFTGALARRIDPSPRLRRLANAVSRPSRHRRTRWSRALRSGRDRGDGRDGCLEGPRGWRPQRLVEPPLRAAMTPRRRSGRGRRCPERAALIAPADAGALTGQAGRRGRRAGR